MNTKFNLLFLLFAISGIAIQCQSQIVTPHPVPEEFVSSRYEVSVNGIPVQVFHAGLNVFFASFDFTGTVDIKVTAGKVPGKKTTNGEYVGQVLSEFSQAVEGKDFWAGMASVKPLSKNIRAKTNGADVTFSLSEPGQYSVERPGTSNYMDQVLFLFANKPETERPKAGDANVIYLEKGVHQRNIDLESGQTLYLEPGAVLFGAINVWNAKNVHILGRGTIVYSGPQSETSWYAAELNNIKNWHPLTTHNTQGLMVSGISVICKSRIWCVRMHSTFDAVFDNVKVLAVNPMNVNGDGFDWQGGGKTKIINSLVRSADDCFAFFIYDPVPEMPAGVAPAKEDIAKSTEIKDVLIENCVLWSTIANVYRVGGGGMDVRTDNIAMKNCDVIHIGKGEWLAPWSIICSVSHANHGKAKNSNYLFENIRFEEPTSFIGIQNEEAQFINIVFRDITMNGKSVPAMVKCAIDGLSFENVKVNGVLVKGKDDVPFGLVTNEIKNLKFK